MFFGPAGLDLAEFLFIVLNAFADVELRNLTASSLSSVELSNIAMGRGWKFKLNKKLSNFLQIHTKDKIHTKQYPDNEKF